MKLLLVQTSFLGDAVLSTPVIAAIKKRYPKAELWLMTTPSAAQLFAADPLLAGVIEFDKRGRDAGLGGLLKFARILRGHGFSAVYALHRSFRTAFLLWLTRIPERVGFKSASGSFLYHRCVNRPTDCHDVERNISILSGLSPIGDEELELRLFINPALISTRPVKDVLDGTKLYCVLVPGSVWNTKRWHWTHYRELADQLIQRGIKVIVCGSSAEEQICSAVADGLDVQNLAGRTSLVEFAAIVDSAQFIVCNDSFAEHVASALKTPTVAVFCSTVVEFGFGPWRNNAVVVQMQDLECRPCGRHGHMNCPLGTDACQHVEITQVLAAIEKLNVWKKECLSENS